MIPSSISDQEFEQVCRFIYRTAGISLSPAKKALVCARLGRRIQAHGFASYGEYLRLLDSHRAGAEAQTAVDLLTTNETYFFREPRHFELLRREALAARGRAQAFRVWSAASSTGEEAYSIAMVLADCLEGADWEVVGSDISVRVLERARRGHYPRSRTTHIPTVYLKRFCLRGTGPEEGTLLIERGLRSRVRFCQVNLNASLPPLGSFDLVFLRNVMIYFDNDTKRSVAERAIGQLRPGGLFCIGHSESLNGITDAVEPLAPSIYRKP